MNCPNCGEELELIDEDSRTEWIKRDYYCSNCKKEWERLTTFKTQSRLVESDELEEVK